MKKFLRCSFAGLLLLGITGCGGPASRPDADILGNGFRDMVRGVAAGRAYDRALLAQQRGDDAAYVKATTKLQNTGAPGASAWAASLTLSRAEDEVARGVALDTLARNQPPAVRKKWELRAMESYRRALVFAPDFQSENPDLLNALGYTLADRGETSKDFQDAEKLTRRSLDTLQKMIAKTESGPVLGQANLRALRYAVASGPHDSLAWALFKLKRYDEALKEQERAIADAKANRPSGLFSDRADSLPDLLYHLGAIHAALSQKDKARAAFDEALQIQPDHAEAKAARAKL